MKVYIGPYKNFSNIYGFLNKLEDKNWITEKKSDKIYDTVQPILDVWNKRPWNKRKINVRIDDYDTWGGDHTLALIIVPLLIKIKEVKQGAPHVKDEDVPEYLRSTSAKPLTKDEENNGGVDDLWFKRYDWVLDEMIWAMTQVRDDFPGDDQYYIEKGEWHTEKSKEEGFYEMVWDKEPVIDEEGLKQYHDRVKNGCRLFGVYFTSLWT